MHSWRFCGSLCSVFPSCEFWTFGKLIVIFQQKESLYRFLQYISGSADIYKYCQPTQWHCMGSIYNNLYLYQLLDRWVKTAFFFFFPQKYIFEAPFLRFWDFTVFVATASTANPWMVTHPSVNRGPSCLTSVFLRELVFPTWYSLRSDWLGDKLSLADYCSLAQTSTKFSLAKTLSQSLWPS